MYAHAFQRGININQPHLCWVAATGYVRAWRRAHTRDITLQWVHCLVLCVPVCWNIHSLATITSYILTQLSGLWDIPIGEL